jgi:hypothetical protein
MDADYQKVKFESFSQADKAAKALRAKNNENYAVYKKDNGWFVGGVSKSIKTPYKRIRSFDDIKALFNEIEEPVDASDISLYAEIIESEKKLDKVTQTSGADEGWHLRKCEIKTGRELGMANNSQYLVLLVEKSDAQAEIKMGGAFSPAIPLIQKQAQTLIGRPIVWHTWNSKARPTQWKNSDWFYMIEPA